MLYTVTDPELHIRGRGGGHPDPEIRGEPSLSKVFFRSAFRSLNLVRLRTVSLFLQI